MNEHLTPPAAPDEIVPAQPRRRRVLWNTAGVAVALIGVVVVLTLWAHSDQFQNMVRTRLATQLQAVTGGRVEIGSFHWKPLLLRVEARNLVIHGDEQPNEAPYAQIARLQFRFSVLGFFSPSIRLGDLEILRPQVHVIFYSDGATNVPRPASRQTGGGSHIETLFKLKAGRIAVEQGLIHLDNRAASLDFQDRYQPLDFRANDLTMVMQYIAASSSPEHYHVDASIRDLNLARGGTLAKTAIPVHAIVNASLDLEKDKASLHSLQVTSSARGVPDRILTIKGLLDHFSNPEWQGTIAGDLDMRLLDPVLGYNLAPEGIAHLELAAGGKTSQFLIDGIVHAEKASYIGTGVYARGIDLTTRVHADQKTLRITSIRARLAQGGEIDGEVLLDHWLAPAAPAVIQPAAPVVPPSASRHRQGFHTQAPSPPPPSHSTLVKKPNVDIPVDGKVTADFKNVTLDTILELVSLPPFQRLGLASIVNGPATAIWTHGDVNTLTVSSTLDLAPSTRLVDDEVPTRGIIDATYSQHDGSVDVRNLSLFLPASRMDAHGHLGAYPLSSPTSLAVNFYSEDLNEFDTVLRDLGLTHRGKTGTQALPIGMGGQAEFHGSWAGSLLSPRLTGNLAAEDISVEIPGTTSSSGPRTIHWDSVTANGSYDAEHIAIVRGEVVHGAAHLQVDGTLTATPTILQKSGAHGHLPIRGNESPAFNADSQLHAHIKADQVAASDLLPLFGSDLPLDGVLDAQVAVEGPLQSPGGSGSAQLTNGHVYGEAVSKISAQGSYLGQSLKLNSFSINSPAGAITGSGTYDLNSKKFALEARGNGLDIAKIQHLQTTSGPFGGRLNFSLTASGTRETPQVEGKAAITQLAYKGQDLGTLNLTAHTVNHQLVYDASSHLDAAQISIHGQTAFTDPYLTQTNFQFSRLDIAALFRMAHLEGISAQSALGGTGSLQGPLAHPAELRGDLRLEPAQLMVAGVHLRSDAPVHIAIANERMSLDPLHITGEDTDLRAQGALNLQQPHRVDLAASGSVNLKLAETLDHDLTASGASTFQIEAHGTIDNPGLRGRIDFQNGSLSLEDIPNGLSQLHGTLEFNQNRLEVKSLTAMTGGGQLNLGGYLAYQHGLYADLSVSGRSIRIRYPQGVSSQADADLRLQGTKSNLLLSGNVLLTRFAVSSDLDIAALAAQANTVQPIVSPDAPSNHVRLDVRVQSSPQLNFQNAYAKLAGDVDLRLRGTLAAPSLLGRVSITEGNATIAGTRYELQRGDITFTNPVRIQPNIDLNATARVEDYDITLGLHGTPDKMSVTYRSDPPLPEADVVALLALGRTQSEQGLYTQQQQQSAGVSPSTDVLLGGALNATVSSRVQKLFGAGSVKVDPSYLGALGNSTTRVTVEEQLGKYVTLTYATNVDTSAQQLLQAEVAINRHVSLQVTRDESGVFSMVLKAIRRYR